LQQIINYFTYKATRTVLHQLYEMNPPKYRWFYKWVNLHHAHYADHIFSDNAI